MSAQIMVDLDRVHPVSDGRWHRVAPNYSGGDSKEYRFCRCIRAWPSWIS